MAGAGWTGLAQRAKVQLTDGGLGAGRCEGRFPAGFTQIHWNHLIPGVQLLVILVIANDVVKSQLEPRTYVAASALGGRGPFPRPRIQSGRSHEQ